VPRALGGRQADPATLVRVIETLAAGDGSAAWCAMIGATSGVASAYLADDAAREIYGTPGSISGGAFAPLGRAIVVDGGYRVTGRWPFASGCEHCTWLMGGSVVVEGGTPRLLPSGLPDSRLMLFPAATRGSSTRGRWPACAARGATTSPSTISSCLPRALSR
jgi:alkylation response protein AidB-like acyl-CoA dehydrogenase